MMRARFENWLNGHWYTAIRPPWYLRILELAYRLVYLRARRRAQLRRKLDPEESLETVPLIVVGNITAGGTGKTPLLIGLCRIAEAVNLRPGIISKGHARHSRLTYDVHPDSSVELCGDEPVLLAKRTNSPVVVASDRRTAIKRLSELGVDVIFSDDGLQQHDLPRSLEICVVDGVRGLGNGHLLPAGPLRESVERLAQVDHVVTTGRWAGCPTGVVARPMQLQPGKICSLDEELEFSVDEFRQKYRNASLHVMAGMGHPQRFFAMLEDLGFKFNAHTFADHHPFRGSDFDHMRDADAILMTEKDAVKCRHLALGNAWYLPVETQLPEVFVQVFGEQLSKLAGHES